MQWLKNKYYTHQYYKITPEGEQKSIYDTCKEAYVLHIYNDQDVIKYHFISKDYEIISPYKVIGLSVCIRNRTYLLPSSSFIIKGNVLFDTPVLRWLCIHYLHIMPCDTCTIVAIDEDANLYTGTQLNVRKTLEQDISLKKI